VFVFFFKYVFEVALERERERERERKVTLSVTCAPTPGRKEVPYRVMLSVIVSLVCRAFSSCARSSSGALSDAVAWPGRTTKDGAAAMLC